MYICFETVALFLSRGNFKTNILIDTIESLLYCLIACKSTSFLYFLKA